MTFDLKANSTAAEIEAQLINFAAECSTSEEAEELLHLCNANTDSDIVYTLICNLVDTLPKEPTHEEYTADLEQSYRFARGY